MTNEELKGQEEAWQEVNPDTSDIWDCEKDKTIQGVYVSKKENVGENKSNIYVLNVGDNKIGVWGSVILDSRFENIKQGQEVKIEYLGKKIGEKGGREYKDYKVYVRSLPFEEVKNDIPVIEADDPNSTAQIAAQE